MTKKLKKPSLRLPKQFAKLPKPRVPKRLKRVGREERTEEAIQNLPRITNETVAEHREEVLRGARKYIYPLEHSKHRIVIVSTTLIITAVIAFFTYTIFALYNLQSTSGFMYRVTQVLPFPIARAGVRFVAYENYLFEMRRYMHYYQTQQWVDFTSKSGKQQLNAYKPQAMQKVVNDAYVKMLAADNHVSVSDAEVTAELRALQAQNKLGSSNQELADVANEFFGWSLTDLRREVQQELLAQKVATKLDTATQQRASSVEQRLQAGADFATLAGQVSDDTATKTTGGAYANKTITTASTDVPPAVVAALSKMQVGDVSKVIPTGTTLEIVKLTGKTGDTYQASHISFNVEDISVFIAPLQKAHPTHYYISVK